jgi:hypothetical protein
LKCAVLLLLSRVASIAASSCRGDDGFVFGGYHLGGTRHGGRREDIDNLTQQPWREHRVFRLAPFPVCGDHTFIRAACRWLGRRAGIDNVVQLLWREHRVYGLAPLPI